jgi:hypothetical protein
VPPADLSARALERQPRRDVRLVIQIGDHNLAPSRERLADREADGSDE